MNRTLVCVALVTAAALVTPGRAGAGDILVNGNFDSAPLSTGWTQISDPLYPPIVTGVNLPPFTSPQSGACLAWMGGITNYSDAIYQDVTVPAGTTQLSFSGYFRIVTSETSPSIYDVCRVELLTPGNVLLETILYKTNLDANGSWAPFTKAFLGNYAGTTVRVRVSSTNDVTDVTSFVFDTFALTATVPAAVDPSLPMVLRLLPPAPNPTGDGARWRLELTATERVNAGVYDLSGRLVRRIAGDVFPAGDVDLRWDGVDAQGRLAPAGLYLCCVEVGGHRLSQRVALVR
jgi:hypothetical protein